LIRAENELIKADVTTWGRELFATFADSGINFKLFMMFAPSVLQTFMQNPVPEKDVFQLI
jgi:hypothetical protein